MQEVAPRAVRMADAIEAISCTINFAVSFLVIVLEFSFFHFLIFTFKRMGAVAPSALVVAASGLVVIGITASTGVTTLVTTLRA